MPQNMINPFSQNYAEWRQLITVQAGLPLTWSFVEERLRELADASNPRTPEFRERYGDAYTQQVIGWFEQAQHEVTS